MANYTDNQWFARVEEFGGRCYYCGGVVFTPQGPVLRGRLFDPRLELTKDHVVPKKRGGVDELWNIVPACLRCNRLKANLTSAEFISARPGLCKFALRFQHVLFLIPHSPVAFGDSEESAHPPGAWAAIIQWRNSQKELRGLKAVSVKSALRELARQMHFDFNPDRKPAESQGLLDHRRKTC